MLGKLTLGNFINGNITLGKCTLEYLPRINLPKVFYPLPIFDEFSLCYGINFFYYGLYSEFNIDSCGKVLYTKKDKFASKIAYVQEFIFNPATKKFTQACL